LAVPIGIYNEVGGRTTLNFYTISQVTNDALLLPHFHSPSY
jgi:hypothetical protein